MKTFKMSINYQDNVLSSPYLVAKEIQNWKDESPYSHAIQATLINSTWQALWSIWVSQSSIILFMKPKIQTDKAQVWNAFQSV